MKRTALKRTAPLKAKGVKLAQGRALPAMSKRTKSEARERSKTIAIVRERDKGCQAVWSVPEVQCAGPLDVHEPKTRARGGNPLDPEACILVCRNHHDWTHDNPASATKLGLLRHSWDA